MQNDNQMQSAAAYLASDFLQNCCDPISTTVNLQAINPYVAPENIDAIIDVELKSVKAKYAAAEDSFVDKELRENPVMCERRPSARFNSDSSSSNRNPLRQQRAESCRRSRISNKIKKAKLQFRHKFITKTLAENVATLEYIKDEIAHTEAGLRSTGYSEASLEKIRKSMGIDRTEIDTLSEIAQQLSTVTEN